MIKCIEISLNPKIGDKARNGRKYYIWNKCPDCQKEFWVPMKGHDGVVRCRSCAALKFHNKRRLLQLSPTVCRAKAGYMIEYVPNDSPFAAMRQSHGYVLQHRLVMAQHLGRCLLTSEIVHHRNGIRDDNRLENLELVMDYQHKAHDAMCQRCVLRKEIRLLRLQIKMQSEQMRELSARLMGL